jgi:hypothetical protein
MPLCSDGTMKISREARPYLWVLGLLWAMPAVTVAGGYLLLSDDVDQNQQSVLTERDTMLWLGIITAPFLFLLGLLAIAVIWYINYNRRKMGR